MPLSKLTDDLNVVQGLPDSPNAGVGGLTSTQLKVKFDTAGNAIKTYLNNTLTTETDAQLALKAPLASPTFTGTPTVTQLQYNTAGGTSGVGKMAWNTTDGTLEFGLTGGNVTLQVGQEEVLRVLNNTGSTIPNGAVVYITGASGQRPTIALAQGNSEATSSKTIGVATESIANNQQGFITLTGLVRDLDTSAFTEGVSLWLSPTVAGGITSTKPVAPNHSVLIGFCIRSHATQGVILAKVQNGNELDELHDVLIGTLANKDLLAYDSASGVWKNQTFGTLDLPTKTYVDSQDALKANIASPAFTGVPTSTTALADTNTTQIATTAFVLGQASATTPIVDGTATIGTSLRYARADHIHPTDTSRAAIASPTFTGVPAAPTAAADTNTTQLATTAFVIGQASSTTPSNNGTAAVGTSLRYARADHVHATDTTRVAKSGDTMTGALTVQGLITGNIANGNGLNLVTTDAGTVDVGGTVLFGGHDGVNANRSYATIGGLKENSTSGNWASYLSLQTRANGGALTERMRITSAGSVLVGTTSNPGTTVTGSGFASGGNGRFQLLMSSGHTTGSVNMISFFNTSTAVSTGNISCTQTATTYGTTSDYRLKDDFQDFKGQELLNKIKVYDYEWKNEKTRSYGVIAHELQEVLPYAVIGEKDAVDEEGNVAPQNVDYSKLVPVLIKTIQEQNERILALEAKVGV